MYWTHEVDPQWLEARKDVLTATELAGLTSGFTKVTKAQKAGESVAPAFAALWGEKHSLMPVDPTSNDAAARGHFLEPYAIEEFNERMDGKWYHWDDCVICNNGIGFSPDAMNIPQGKPIHNRLDVVKGKLVDTNGNVVDKLPTSILEVKSYGIGNHMKNVVANKMSLKERWQIAAAFLTIPTLEEAYLVQYCPQTELGLFYHRYEREDLEDEIEKLREIIQVWNATCQYFDAMWQPEMTCCYTEEQIMEDYANYMLDGSSRFE